VSEPLRTPIALIVDDDLGFVLWVRQLLGEASWEGVPALSCQQALGYAKQLNLEVDLVVVNPNLPGVSAMLQALSGANSKLRIIVIRLPGIDVPEKGARATLEKARAWQTISHEEWLRKLQQALSDAPRFVSNIATIIFRE